MTSSSATARPRISFWLSAAAAALALALVSLTALPPGSAAASTGQPFSEHCQVDGGDPQRVRCLFAGEGAYTLPLGPVATADVDAVGAAGGSPRLTFPGASVSVIGAPGGRGAEVTGTVAVPSGALHVMVGGLSTRALQSVPFAAFNGGGPAGATNYMGTWTSIFTQGGGGGASDVRTVAPGGPGTLESRLLVAGGGGGG
ncbi:MAG TPA: glycine-rich protein, partial [Solirubrobacteraceae bacterium]|nr:glycine-rich protein [Solirubrobacteraceae bacterium]